MKAVNGCAKPSSGEALPLTCAHTHTSSPHHEAFSSDHRYDFDKHHDGIKQMGMQIDFFTWGMEPMALILFFGDVIGARTGIAKVNDAHKRMLARVRQEEATAEGYVHSISSMRLRSSHALNESLPCRRYSAETLVVVLVQAASLLLVDDFDTLRELITNSLAGGALDDEALRAGFSAFWQGPFGWKTEEGYCALTFESSMLLIRGLAALVEEDTEISRTSLRAWLPPTAELLRIIEYEVTTMSIGVGANHPALLCARLHGERLGDWKAAAEVAENFLRVEQFHPLQRTETLRLLGRAKAALGERTVACEVAERAVAEAAGAKYVWLEMLSLRDLLRWCEVSEAEGVRARLRDVARRLATSGEELTGLLGNANGVLYE